METSFGVVLLVAALITFPILSRFIRSAAGQRLLNAPLKAEAVMFAHLVVLVVGFVAVIDGLAFSN